MAGENEANLTGNQDSNGHGGRRDGAGRKPGARTKKTQRVALELTDDGEPTPLEVMVETMRALRRSAMGEDPVLSPDALATLVTAAEVAAKAAPYMHSRLTAISHTGPDGGSVRIGLDLVEVARQLHAIEHPGA